MKNIIIYNLFFFILLSCGSKKDENTLVPYVGSESDLIFSVNEPTQTFELGSELTEISGLAFSSISNNLLTVNDELGVIYVLNPETADIIDKIEFGQPDDYEGITSHDGYIYVVESNGNVKVIKEESKAKVAEFNDRLSRDNDIEGICYDATSQSILLAAKGDSETEGNTKNVKSVFTMNIDNGAVRKKAYIQLDLKKEYESLHPNFQKLGKLERMSMSARLRKNGPSGIAIDPITNLIFLLSSNSKTLTMLDRKGDVKSISLLDKKLHAQPEGITFDNNGNLFIANEGNGGKGMIYKFTRK